MRRFILGLVLLTSACGSDGGSSSSTTFSSSVPATAKLSDLSSTQLSTLCNELKSYAQSSSVYADALEGGCRLAGILAGAFSSPKTDSELQQACMPVYNQCKSAPPGQGSSQLACTAPPSGCQATVGDLTTCLNDSFAAESHVLSSIPSCSQVTLSYLKMDGGSSVDTTPASCQSFATKCPGSSQ
jgi:hypothetical protein